MAMMMLRYSGYFLARVVGMAVVYVAAIHAEITLFILVSVGFIRWAMVQEQTEVPVLQRHHVARATGQYYGRLQREVDYAIERREWEQKRAVHVSRERRLPD